MNQPIDRRRLLHRLAVTASLTAVSSPAIWPVVVRAQAATSTATPEGGGPLGEEAWRADLRQVRGEFLARDRAYAAAAREAAEAHLARLETGSGPMPFARLALELAAIAALADNGHTAALPAGRVARTNRVPVRMVPFGGDFHVVRTRDADADLLGARLVAIDGSGVDRLREAARSLAGGTAAWRDQRAPFLFESPEQLQALALVRRADAATYHFEKADGGGSIERRLAGEAPHPARPRASTERLLLPQVTGEDLGWRCPLALVRAPWALQDALAPMRMRHALDIDALVVDLRVTNDTATHKLAELFTAVRAAAARQQPKHLVLDLRGNGGGDLTRARAFAVELPSLVPGRLFVLTSPWTFSAAIATAGYVKQAAPQRVTLVGEHAGDRLMFFAEGRPIRLQHSGLLLLPAGERHDYRDGCRAFSDCHANVVRHPIAIATLEPEIAAPWTYAAWREGIDPAMEAVALALRAEKR